MNRNSERAESLITVDLHLRTLLSCSAVVIACAFSPLCALPLQAAGELATNRYEFHREHDPDGIGKFYMGREIAHVMGHQAADWLDLSEREAEEHASQLMHDLPD